ncbi:MAG: molybdate transport system substrate-binding protein [Acidimicrobiaceae bacterium]
MRRITWLFVAAFLILAACGSDATAPKSVALASGAKAAPSGPVLVFAAASLTESLTNEKTTLQSEQPGLDVTLNFAGSGTLITQIQQGAEADVIATADTASMQKLVDAGLVETPTVFAHNKLAIVVQSGNPKAIHTLADLARPDVTVVLADPSVPAGKYASQILTKADVMVEPKSLETDVKSAIARVTSGEADAAIVYVTDVKAAGGKAEGVDIPDSQNVVADYPIAIVKATKHHDAAAAFVDAITKGSGQAALSTSGFLTAA